jgi:hypothetical protein
MGLPLDLKALVDKSVGGGRGIGETMETRRLRDLKRCCSWWGGNGAVMACKLRRTGQEVNVWKNPVFI